MATAGFNVCGICEMRHKTNYATVWCPECEDPLCADCEEHHSISKGTRNHTTVPIGDYQELPPFILDAKMYCEEHNEKYHHYCMSHERPLCKICVVTVHRACKDLKTIEDVTGNCKSSYVIEAVEKDLREIACNIEHVKQDRESNLSAIEKQRNSIIKKVSELRAKINQHLDRIEKVFFSDLSSVADENEKRIADLLDSLNSKKSKIKELQKSIRGMKEHASDFQTFIGMKEIENIIHEEKGHIRSIFESASLNQIEMSCSFDSLIENCITSTEKMGTLSVKENPPQINLEIESDKQAQAKSPVDHLDNDQRFKLHTIFVTGLNEEISEDALVNHFGSLGVIMFDQKINKPKVWINKYTIFGETKGEATITYDDPATAQAAIHWFNGTDFEGGVIKVEIARRVHNSFDTRGGGRGGGGRRGGGLGFWGSRRCRGRYRGIGGDWTCPNGDCGNNIAYFRDSCDRCNSARPEGVGGWRGRGRGSLGRDRGGRRGFGGGARR